MKKLGIALASAALLAGCGSAITPNDGQPSQPRKITQKKIDPRKCERYRKNNKGIRTCVKWDDKDYIFVVQDGSAWDVDKAEYDRFNVGDWWPTNS